jgi:hypothetical protein
MHVSNRRLLTRTALVLIAGMAFAESAFPCSCSPAASGPACSLVGSQDVVFTGRLIYSNDDRTGRFAQGTLAHTMNALFRDRSNLVDRSHHRRPLTPDRRGDNSPLSRRAAGGEARPLWAFHRSVCSFSVPSLTRLRWRNINSERQ